MTTRQEEEKQEPAESKTAAGKCRQKPKQNPQKQRYEDKTRWHMGKHRDQKREKQTKQEKNKTDKMVGQTTEDKGYATYV